MKRLQTPERWLPRSRGSLFSEHDHDHDEDDHDHDHDQDHDDKDDYHDHDEEKTNSDDDDEYDENLSINNIKQVSKLTICFDLHIYELP